MKIRSGHVSNSSSTSFVFYLKDNTLDYLISRLRKYHQHFELENPYPDIISAQEIGVEDVIREIMNIEVEMVSIDEVIEMREAELAEINNYSESPYKIEYILEAQEECIEAERMKKDGFTSVAVIGFGDNHGDITGNAVGMIMDYEGRYIHINHRDFRVRTFQNR